MIRPTLSAAIAYLWSAATVTHYRRDGEGDGIERACSVTYAKVLYVGNQAPEWAREHFAYQVTRALRSRPDLAERIATAMAAEQMAVAS